MTIWTMPGVDLQPVVTLIRWRVLLICQGPATGARHLCGFNIENGAGRCSTAITSIDRENMHCTTQSGRLYVLKGRPSFDRDGDYVWQIASRGIATIDVTDDIFGTVPPYWPQIRDLPVSEQEPFSAWLEGQAVPSQGCYFLRDYIRWKDSTGSND